MVKLLMYYISTFPEIFLNCLNLPRRARGCFLVKLILIRLTMFGRVCPH